MTPLAAREYFDLVIRHSFDVFVKQCFAELNPGTPYIENWHVEAIAHRLELCRAGESKRLIITVPPRSLKSLCASIAFPAFVLGHAPTQRLIIVTYSQELGSKFTMAFRRIVNSAWYQRIFPNTRALKETETEFVTTKGGERVSISIGGSLTGRGGNFIIIDDPLKADEAMSRAARERVNEYYGSTLFSRLDDKRCGVIVLVMQRLHEEDLAGQLLRGGGWWHLDLPAIAQEDACFELMRGRKHYRSHGDLLHPEREPWQILDEIKQTLGTYAFQAQYQQRPVSDAGNLVHRDWICYYDALPPRNTTSSIIQSWDTALKGEEMHDFSVCTTWLRQGNDHYLMDVARKHCDYPELRRLASQLHYQYKPDITLIEDRGNGSSLIADLWHFESIRAVGIKPEGDKQTRLAAVSPLIEQGSVLFPRRAPWLADLIDELLRFPQTKFDDQVDSLSQYLNWARLRARTTLFKVDWM
jgi:predicted phage terminase large subunit-like protein